MASEHDTLIKINDNNVQTHDVTGSRKFYQYWMFVNNLSFGIISSCSGTLFSEVIDNGKSGKSEFYFTLAMAMYSVTSFLCSPIASTLSDQIGRKPLFVVSGIVNCFTGVMFGLYANNWIFVCMVLLQGAGDNSFPVGYALLVDSVMGSQETIDETIVQDICKQFTMGIILQTAGLITGLVAGNLLMDIMSVQVAISVSGLVYLVFAFNMDWQETRKPKESVSLGVVSAAVWDLLHYIPIYFGNSRIRLLSLVIFVLQFCTSVTLDAEFVRWKDSVQFINQEWIAQLTIVASLVGSLTTWSALAYIDENKIIGCMCLIASTSCVAYLLLPKVLSTVSTLMFGFGIGCMPLLFTLITCEATQDSQGLVQGFTYGLLTLAMSLPKLIKISVNAIAIDSGPINRVVWASMFASLLVSAVLLLQSQSSSAQSKLVQRAPSK